MTAIDRDQVLQKLETLHDSQAKSHDMALWRDGVWQAILEVRSIGALPAIPLDDGPKSLSLALSSWEQARDERDAALARVTELANEVADIEDRLNDLCERYDLDGDEDVLGLIERELAVRALPVLETKKEES